MGYDYLNRTYGTAFKAGQRVTFDEYADKPGTVKRVSGSSQYVSVKFDDGTDGMCHPSSVTVTA